MWQDHRSASWGAAECHWCLTHLDIVWSITEQTYGNIISSCLYDKKENIVKVTSSMCLSFNRSQVRTNQNICEICKLQYK